MGSTQPNRYLPDPDAEPTISVLRAGAILGMSRNASYAAAKDGRLPTVAISASRLVVLTSEFLARYRLTPSQGRPSRRTPSQPLATPGPASARVLARWHLDGGRRRVLVLSCLAWPPMRPGDAEQVALAAADACEAAVGVALGRPGVAS